MMTEGLTVVAAGLLVYAALHDVAARTADPVRQPRRATQYHALRRISEPFVHQIAATFR